MRLLWTNLIVKNQCVALFIPLCETIFSISQWHALCHAAKFLRHKKNFHIVKFGESEKKPGIWSKTPGSSHEKGKTRAVRCRRALKGSS
jgi:hypothetical protein